MNAKTLIGVLLSFLISFSANATKLTVVADEWPPFSGQKLPNKGLSANVIKSVLTRAGYEVEVKILPWARIMHGANQGEFDIVGSLFYSEELIPHMAYSNPYFETEIKFIKAKGSNADFIDMESLKSQRIAVGDEFLYSPEFDNADNLNKIVATTTLQCVQMVAYGRADLTLDSIEVLKYTIANDAPELQDAIEYLPTPLDSQAMYMAVSRKTPKFEKVLKDFNSTLGEMRRDGSYDEIIQKHTGH